MKNNKSKIILIVCLCIFVGGLSVAYAVLFKTLTINGNAEINSNVWQIKLANASCSKTGDATAGNPSINGTTLSISGMKLVSPGDTVTCTFDVSNSGTVKAKLADKQELEPIYVGTGTNAIADQELIASSVDRSITYADGTAINIGDIINPSEVKQMKLIATYKTNSSIPTNDVVIKNIGIKLTYEQK